MDEYWRKFEKRIKDDLGYFNDTAVTRIPSHLERGRGGASFRKKTDCDFVASVNGKAVFFDAKACGETRFNIQSLILRESKIHQYEFLLRASKRGAVGGYLIWFYTHSKIVWLPVELVQELVLKGDKSLHVFTEGLRAQNDDKLIILKELVWGTNS